MVYRVDKRVILRVTKDADSNYFVLSDSNGLILSYVTTSDDEDLNIQDLIRVLKKPYISVRHRICVLKSDETVDYEIPNSDIVDNSISFSENLQNGQRRSLSFTLINNRPSSFLNLFVV